MKIEGYLSQKIQSLYPKAIVVEVEGKYKLRQCPVSDDIELGNDFQQAKMAIFALLRADLPLLSQNHLEAYNLLKELLGLFDKYETIPKSYIKELISKSEKVIAREEIRTAKKAK